MRRALLASVVMVLSSCSFLYYPATKHGPSSRQSEPTSSYPRCSTARAPYVMDLVGAGTSVVVALQAVALMAFLTSFGDSEEDGATLSTAIIGGGVVTTFLASAGYGATESSECRSRRQAADKAGIPRPPEPPTPPPPPVEPSKLPGPPSTVAPPPSV